MSSLESHVKAVLDDNLKVVAPGQVDTQSHDYQRMAAFAKLLFEQCYVCDHCGDEELSQTQIDRARRKRADLVSKILVFFPTPMNGELIHPCPDGCPCREGAPERDRAKSVEMGFSLVKPILFQMLGTPALNKYTKVDPVVRRTTLLQHFLLGDYFLGGPRDHHNEHRHG